MSKMKQALIVVVLAVLIAVLISCRDTVRIYGVPYKLVHIRDCNYSGFCCQYGPNYMKKKQPYEYFCGFHGDCPGHQTVESEYSPYQWRYVDENQVSGTGKEEVILRVIDQCR